MLVKRSQTRLLLLVKQRITNKDYTHAYRKSKANITEAVVLLKKWCIHTFTKVVICSASRIKSKSGGRNNNGRITTRHGGGGHKQHYRIIDFKRTKDNIPATVERIEYDPNRTAHIAFA